MRAFACALAISLAFILLFGRSAEAAGPPKRVASLNLCTDELLLMLALPDQIISVTHLSQDAAESPLWRESRRYRRNDGTLANVAPFNPDLVIDMGSGPRDVANIASRLGIKMLTLPYPQSLADLERSIAMTAAALGRREAGLHLLRRIAILKKTAPSRAMATIWLGGGGRSVAPAGLAADWMRLAAMRQRKLRGDRVTLEQLLLSPPPILLKSDYRARQYSGQQRWLRHPLAKGTEKSRSIRTDGRLWTCMGPLMIDEVLRLRKEAAL